VHATETCRLPDAAQYRLSCQPSPVLARLHYKSDEQWDPSGCWTFYDDVMRGNINIRHLLHLLPKILLKFPRETSTLRFSKIILQLIHSYITHLGPWDTLYHRTCMPYSLNLFEREPSERHFLSVKSETEVPNKSSGTSRLLRNDKLNSTATATCHTCPKPFEWLATMGEKNDRIFDLTL
jgi:hypothetical protein